MSELALRRLLVRRRRWRPPSARRVFALIYACLALYWIGRETLLVLLGEWWLLPVAAFWGALFVFWRRVARRWEGVEERGGPVPPPTLFEWGLLAFNLAWSVLVWWL